MERNLRDDARKPQGRRCVQHQRQQPGAVPPRRQPPQRRGAFEPFTGQAVLTASRKQQEQNTASPSLLRIKGLVRGTLAVPILVLLLSHGCLIRAKGCEVIRWRPVAPMVRPVGPLPAGSMLCWGWGVPLAILSLQLPFV